MFALQIKHNKKKWVEAILIVGAGIFCVSAGNRENDKKTEITQLKKESDEKEQTETETETETPTEVEICTLRISERRTA
ncbi:unknown [Roseburia sp. CAG:303]|nr:unknown [Roseburia sp. CAG:303]